MTQTSEGQKNPRSLNMLLVRPTAHQAAEELQPVAQPVSESSCDQHLSGSFNTEAKVLASEVEKSDQSVAIHVPCTDSCSTRLNNSAALTAANLFACVNV